MEMANNSSAQIPVLSDLLAQLSFDDSSRYIPIVQDAESPYNIDKFEAFLMKSHCEENFEFWKNCNYYLENYNKPTFSYSSWNEKTYETFIQENAPMECNLPERIRNRFTAWHNNNEEPDNDVLLMAKQHAIDLMADAYRRFIRDTNKSRSTTSLASAASTTCPSTTYSVAATTSDTKVSVKRTIGSSARSNVGEGKNLPTIKTSFLDANRSASSLLGLEPQSSSEASMPRGVLTRSNSSGTQNFLERGKALVTKLRGKKMRPRLAASPSSNSNNIFGNYSHFKSTERTEP